MMKEAQQHVRMAAQECEVTINVLAHVCHRCGDVIFGTLFGMSMTVFFGVQFRRIGWQRLNKDVIVSRQIRLDWLGIMRARLIPYHDLLAGHLTIQLLKPSHDTLALDGLLEMSFEQLA